MSCNKVFSERLFEIIKKSGKSVNQIERELGYSRNSISNYKNSSEPSGTRLVELANYLKVTPDYLVGLSNEPNINKKSINDIFIKLSSNEKIELFKVYKEWLSNYLGGECSLDININIIKKDE
ncbi:helix-turn-helix transcriptional regulator [Lactococcus lactis]|uniref:helix-turn-helix domain-containing protein n=1 Tax=Lactococcus lactis TaxID=1358 RepID=UPI00265A41C8|nr:helix-turn-helix transcriptional regulator [Lactococcus lactis]WKF72348.1 helix-turn-helix transcriptional regulator [Lactococcus lactis]